MKSIFPMLFAPALLFGQDYTAYRTGNANALAANPQGGICLMGGATEHDEAMRWFLQRADGGDVLVLRASGADGYNAYFYNDLGVSVNSVETIVFNNANAAQDNYIHQRLLEADAIWLAGGDQWDYLSYWRATPIDSLIRLATARGAVLGGTSAGMAVQGGAYFTAQNGTITSADALGDPYDTRCTPDTARFLGNSLLEDVITDTHYDNPDRRGRQVVFLARLAQDYGMNAKGIACDEYTAVCVDTAGLARVFGDYPNYDDNAYFLQLNCELSDPLPETCVSGQPLTWDRGAAALKVYAVKGTMQGANSFDLRDWSAGVGGSWEHWSVQNGVWTSTAGSEPACPLSSLRDMPKNKLSIFPNPSDGALCLQSQAAILRLQIVDMWGRMVWMQSGEQATELRLILDLPVGWYGVGVETVWGWQWMKWRKG